jgi:CheY-like chemotaxis protein
MTNENGRIRVLVVDDERLVADTLALILRGQGYQTRAVYSGEDAVEVALAWQPTVVISDVIMGELDGVGLATCLAQSLPACKVFLMSGNPAAAPLIRSAQVLGHIFPILAKPFHPSTLFDVLTPLYNGCPIQDA